MNEWVCWAIVCLGGFLTVSVLLISEANLSRTVIFNVLLPGTSIGTLLMLIGALGAHYCKNAREKAMLGRLLEKTDRFRLFK